MKTEQVDTWHQTISGDELRVKETNGQLTFFEAHIGSARNVRVVKAGRGDRYRVEALTETFGGKVAFTVDLSTLRGLYLNILAVIEEDE